MYVRYVYVRASPRPFSSVKGGGHTAEVNNDFCVLRAYARICICSSSYMSGPDPRGREENKNNSQELELLQDDLVCMNIELQLELFWN